MVGTRLSQRSQTFQRKESSDSSEESFVDTIPELCNICKKTLDDDEEDGEHIKSIECEQCGKWSHNACANVTPDIFELINQHNFRWFCPPCENKSLNLSHIFVHYQLLQYQHSELVKEVAVLKSKLDAREEGGMDVLTENGEKVNLVRMSEEISSLKSQLKESQTSKPPDNPMFPQLLDANTPQNKIVEFVDTHIKPVINTTVSKSDEVASMLSDMIHEKEQIQKIRLNLVISGIEESNSPDEDMVKVTNLVKKELNVTPLIEKVERCGKKRTNPDGSSSPRLLKLFMQNSRSRKDLLQRAKDLRESRDENVKGNVFIRPDQTPKQQLESKNLRDQLRQMRAANQDPNIIYYIRRGVIEEREKVQE